MKRGRGLVHPKSQSTLGRSDVTRTLHLRKPLPRVSTTPVGRREFSDEGGPSEGSNRPSTPKGVWNVERFVGEGSTGSEQRVMNPKSSRERQLITITKSNEYDWNRNYLVHSQTSTSTERENSVRERGRGWNPSETRLHPDPLSPRTRRRVPQRPRGPCLRSSPLRRPSTP